MSDDEATGPQGDELERVLAENARLRAEVEAAEAKPPSRRRVRRSVAALLAFLSALLIVLSVVAGWTSRTALNTDAFVSRVGPVIEDPTVRAAVDTKLGDELVAVLDLQDRISNVLPSNISFLAGPMASAANDVVRKQVTKLVYSDQFTALWYSSLRLAHTQVVTALTGSDAHLQVVRGKVNVDLINVIGKVLEALPQQLPTVLGQNLSLQIPANLPVDQIRALVSRYLGIDLPQDFALFPVMDKSTLDAAKQGVKVLNLSVLLVILAALVTFVLALVASVDRRRTLLQVGLWLALITAAVTFALRTIVDQAIAGVADPTLRPAVTAGVRELFSTLRGRAVLLLWVGLIVAVVLYLAGPGRFPRALRGWAVRGYDATSERVRTVAASEGFSGWVARNLDPLRIGGAVVAALLLVWLSSWTALVVIGVLLVLYEVGVTLYARSTPSGSAVADEDETVAGTP